MNGPAAEPAAAFVTVRRTVPVTPGVIVGVLADTTRSITAASTPTVLDVVLSARFGSVAAEKTDAEPPV